ncbi:MAG: efflux RND transporter periplasmic adaptor subunit [Candidatus Dactylopiibacterium sp.]|nr:efflux RND transporter periplasmic adaptor subunit [Candidatus Dactylopiibacterium sp.]
MSQEALDSLRISRQTSPRRSRRKPVLFALAILVVAAGIFLALRERPHEISTGRAALAWPSQGITALNATGYVVAGTKAAVASKTTGRIEWLGVQEGSEVRAGEVIARMENAEIRAQLAQREANIESALAALAQARAEAQEADFNLRRQRELTARGFVAQAAVDAASNRAAQAHAAVQARQAAVRTARAAADEIRVALDNTLIRAPFAGVVLTKQADVGDVVTPLSASTNSKAAVVTMADLSTLEIEADVSETSLAHARVGQPVEIQFDALPQLRLLGQVARIVPTVDRSRATVKFKIRFDEKDARVLPDMSARVAFLTRALQAGERTPRLVVPPTAIRDGKVFVLKDGRARLRTVEAGARLGDMQEIRGGVEAGEDVILAPPPRLSDGDRATEKKA